MMIMRVGNSIKEYKSTNVLPYYMKPHVHCLHAIARLVMREEKKPRYNNKVLSKHFH